MQHRIGQAVTLLQPATTDAQTTPAGTSGIVAGYTRDGNVVVRVPGDMLVYTQEEATLELLAGIR